MENQNNNSNYRIKNNLSTNYIMDKNRSNRFNYYCKKWYFNNREEARKITNYLINNNLSIKFIEYVKYWFELIDINYL